MLLLSSFSPQLAEIGFLLLEFRIVAQRYKGTVQGSQRGLEGPCIRPRCLNRRDPRAFELLQCCDKAVPRLRGIIRVKSRFFPQVSIDDIA